MTAHHGELDNALARIHARFGPQSVMAKYSPECRAQCATIVDSGVAAHEALKNRKERIAYRRDRYTPTELSGYAALLIDKMHLARFRGQDRLAIQLFEVAMELDPRSVDSISRPG
jgi:hypothetical protein